MKVRVDCRYLGSLEMFLKAHFPVCISFQRLQKTLRIGQAISTDLLWPDCEVTVNHASDFIETYCTSSLFVSANDLLPA